MLRQELLHGSQENAAISKAEYASKLLSGLRQEVTNIITDCNSREHLRSECIIAHSGIWAGINSSTVLKSTERALKTAPGDNLYFSPEKCSLL